MRAYIDILSAEYQRDPHYYNEIMQEQYPLFYHAGTQSYILSRYEDVKFALRSPLFSSRN